MVRVSIDLSCAPHGPVRGVAEPRSRREHPGDETARNVSRAVVGLPGRFFALLRGLSPVGAGVTALGAIGGALMFLSAFLTIRSIGLAMGGNSCEVIAERAQRAHCQLSGFESHSFALPLIGLIVLVMAFGAGRGRSKPAAAALVVLGALVLAIALLSDLPKTHETGAIGPRFEGASAKAGSGLYVEIAGGIAAMGAGLIGLVLPGEPEPRSRRERAARTGGPA